MSWSIYSVPVPEEGKDTMDSVLDRAAGSNPAYRQTFEAAEVKDQVAAAVAALDELMASGAVGPGPFLANLSGQPDEEVNL